MKKIITLFLVCFTVFVQAQGYNWFVKSYSVNFKIKNAKLNVSGILGGLKATIAFDPLNPLNGTFEGNLDVKTLKTGINMRDNHLKKTEYFNVEKFPDINLKTISVSKIKEDETFKALGVDSLHALQLKNKLQDDFSLSINVAAVWQYPTVQKFADFIVNELNLEAQFSNKTEEKNEEPVLVKNDIESEVRNLSLEELMKELSSKVD